MSASQSPNQQPLSPEAAELNAYLDEYGIGEDLLPRDFLRRQRPIVQNVPQPSTLLHHPKTAKRSQLPKWQSDTAPPPPSTFSALTPRQLHAARLLVAGHNDSSAAAILGVHRHTLRRWRRVPEVRAELHRLLKASIKQ
jgi:hypothetical protein